MQRNEVTDRILQIVKSIAILDISAARVVDCVRAAPSRESAIVEVAWLNNLAALGKELIRDDSVHTRGELGCTGTS